MKKIIKKATEEWLFNEIIGLARYRNDIEKIQDPLANYLNDPEEFKIMDRSSKH